MRACSVLAEILSVIFNIWTKPEQTQILIQVRSHVYMWVLHIEEDCALCNMFDAWKWMQFHVIKCMWGQKHKIWYYKNHFNAKERCFDFSYLLSYDFFRSMSHYLIVQVTLFLAVTVLRYNSFSVLIFLLYTRFSKFNKSGEADVFRLGLNYSTISGTSLIQLEQYCKKLPHLCQKFKRIWELLTYK